MSRLQLAIRQINFACAYTIRLLDHTKVEDWFRFAADGVTNIAWQDGHLAVAEYRMGMERIRGVRPEDEKLISESFRKVFGKGSAAEPTPAKFNNAGKIRAVFDRVHQQLLRELADLDERELDSPVLKEQPLIKTKLWALLWCAQHEGVHGGQIGLLRRVLGYPPVC